MSPNAAASNTRHISTKALKLGASFFALASAWGLAPTSAYADTPFGTMVGMQAGLTIGSNGQVSQWTGANAPVIGMEGDRHLMTIEQTQAKALLDWEDFRLRTDEILEFQQASEDWLVVNRVHGDYAAEVNGEIRALGSVYIFNDNGVLIGEDAQINTRKLVAGTGVSDVNVDGNTTTFVQSQAKAVLEWQKFEVQTDEVLKFQQESSDWLVINRDLTEPTSTVSEAQLIAANATINGTIRADGILVINDETGFNIGENASIEADRYFLTQGISDIDVTDTDVSITQGRERAVVNWSDMNLADGQSITFIQEDEDWLALNRHIGGGLVTMDGDITADAGILLVSSGGLAINGSIEAGQVIASALEIRDDAFNGFLDADGGLFSYQASTYVGLEPTFSNSWIYADGRYPDSTTEGKTNRYLNLLNDALTVVDENDPLLYNVTVGSTGTIATGDRGKIMLFGPNVTNRGILSVQDEGEVILGAGDNVFITSTDGITLDVYTSTYNPFDMLPANVVLSNYGPSFLSWAYDSTYSKTLPTDSVIPEEWVAFVNAVTGGKEDGSPYVAGETLSKEVAQSLVYDTQNKKNGGLIANYIEALRAARAEEVGFSVVNEGIITGTCGSDVTMRGWTIVQNGAITLTSTANFRAEIDMQAVMQDEAEDTGVLQSAFDGNGTVIFGENSLTQITPDLEADDTLPLTEGNQSVGSLFVAGQYIHLQENSLIYMPSGTVDIYADAGTSVLDPLGAGGNADSQDGSRFMMEDGATIDLSGWEVTRDMGYHEVTGTVYVAQLADSPAQDGGPLYLKEITVDRRYGTDIVDWESFDNLTELTLDQMIVDGGMLTLAVGDDFIMKSGSVIDVSGGSVTYEEGYVYTTQLRRLDGSVIDIREANPDEVYMGLADQWVVYDTKWGQQESYYIPLLSSSLGQYEESYVEGGNAGTVSILAPDGVYQGTFLGDVTVGKYQSANIPEAGSLFINAAGEYDQEYISTRVLIAEAIAQLGAGFDFGDSLTSLYEDLFGEEEERSGNYDAKGNLTLISEDLFERSTMGTYDIAQWYLGEGGGFSGTTAGAAYGDNYIVVEDGVDLTFANGATFNLIGTSAMYFGGSLSTNGGDVALRGQGIVFSADSFIDTSAAWYSEYELYDYVPLAERPIVDGGDILVMAFRNEQIVNEVGAEYAFIIPETVYFNANGGGYLNRDGKLTAGMGGDIDIRNYMTLGDTVDLSGAFNAQSYGLGGNGMFAFETSGEIYVGEELPGDAESRNIAALITPDFYEEMPFSGIYLSAPTITIAEGTDITATQATMQLATGTLENGVPAAWLAASGTDILDVTTIDYIEPGYRDEALQDGADLAFTRYAYSDDYTQISLLHLGTYSADEDSANGASLTADSSVTVNPGGSILFNGDIAGTLSAPAGTISLGGTLYSTARILAQGAVRITGRSTDSNGNEVISGVVLDGGEVNYTSGSSDALTAEEGAVIDVSGTSAELSLTTGSSGGVVQELTTVSSDGGTIYFYGSSFDVNNITFHADAGGEGARGGTFMLQWIAGDYEELSGLTGSALVSKLTNQYYKIETGGYTRGLVGVDLSTIDWDHSDYGVGVDLQFEEGTYLPEDLTELAAAFDAWYAAEESVPAPIFYIGEGELAELPDYSTLPEIDQTMMALYEALGYALPSLPTEQTSMTLSPENIAEGGFSSVQIAASSAIVVAGKSQLGGLAEDGSYLIDEVIISTPSFYGQEDADFTVLANTVRLFDTGSLNENGGTTGLVNIDEDRFNDALAAIGISEDNLGTSFTVEAGKLIDITSATLVGFEDVLLASAGDIRFTPTTYSNSDTTPEGYLTALGNLTLQADQVYTASGRIFTVEAGDTLTILPPDEDDEDINETPLEGAASLTLRAPRIVQGGIVRSPLGSIMIESYDDGSEGADTISLLAGSITSVSADGNVIPYGTLVNGDTWVDPFTGEELTYLPDREINLVGDVIDFAEGATVDISAGGDLVASEFVSGVGGTTDWLSGYRDEDYEWVEDSSEIYAIIPGYDADVTPLGTGNGYAAEDLGKIYLSGNNAYGLPEGEYTLLPAEYAILPGAYRVTVNHQYGDYTGMVLGTTAAKEDGSVIQAGYRYVANADGSIQYIDQYTNGYLVMSSEVLAKRTQYNATTATSYFDSEAFLEAALRSNLEVESLPRTPNDGGGLSLVAGSSLTLDGTVEADAEEDGKGGYIDIASENILVAGEDTDLSGYDDYLILKADRLVSFGVESLLLGGSREQTDTGAAIVVSARDVVVDTAGDVLSGSDLILAAIDGVTVKTGSVIEATGELSSPTESYSLVAAYELFATGDDVSSIVHDNLDQGALLHVSAGDRADFLRDSEAVDAMAALLADPTALAALNAQRTAAGLAEISADGGVLTIEDGATLVSSRSLVLDATSDTSLASGASLEAEQITASASQVSIGDAPAASAGLAFTGETAAILASAADVALKSYTSIDFYGAVDFVTEGDLTLDAREIRLLDNDGGTASISAGDLTLANSNGGETTATAGNAELVLTAENITLSGGMKAISGADDVTLTATGQMIGYDDGGLNLPGNVTLEAAQLTVNNGDVLAVNADGTITVNHVDGAELDEVDSFGATLALTGASILHTGQIALDGGTVSMQATTGDIALAEGSTIDVSGTSYELYDVTIGIDAGVINLVSDLGDVTLAEGALLDISGGEAADAGALNISVVEGEAVLDGTLNGEATEGYSSGDFDLLIGSLDDFGGLSDALTAGGLNGSRSFEILTGSVTLDGTTEVEGLSLIVNDGSIDVTGSVTTTGDNGGLIALAASEDVTLAGTAALVAAVNAEDGAGGTVLIETAGANSGSIAMASGALIDVSGAEGEGGTVHFRAPQVGGNDIAIDELAGTIAGADKAIAEAFAVYEDVETIDDAVIDTVSADATDFMTAATANGVQDRLGAVTLIPGIDIRNDGDMELVDDWDLSTLRFGADQVAGVLSLRATGDLLINANLTDSDTATGSNWDVNLVAGANLDSPSVLAVLAESQLADGKGSVIIGGEADELDYVALDPEDYDLTITEPDANYELAWEYLIDDFNSAYSRGGRVEDATVSYLFDLSDGVGAGTISYEDAYNAGLAYIVANNPTALATSSKVVYTVNRINSYILRRSEVTDQMAAEDVATLQAIYDSRKDASGSYVDDATATALLEEAFTLLYTKYPDIFMEDFLRQLETVDASPYYLRTTGYESFLYNLNADGTLGDELERDPATGKYIDPVTNALIEYEEGETDYTDTDYYARDRLDWVSNWDNRLEITEYGSLIQTYNPTGYTVSTHDAAITVTAGRDLVLEQRPSSLQATGTASSVAVNVAGDIIAHDDLAKTVATDVITEGTASITAGGMIDNLTVSAVDMVVQAGGDIAGGVYDVTGTGLITSGGSIVSGSEVVMLASADPETPYDDCGSGYDICHYDQDPTDLIRHNALYTLFYANEAGDLRVEAAGDLNIETATGGGDASVSFYSAGGDVITWNNDVNILSAALHDELGAPYYVAYSYAGNVNISREDATGQEWAGTVELIAAGGDVNVLGGFTMAPSQYGNLDIYAQGDVQIGAYERMEDMLLPNETGSLARQEYALWQYENNLHSAVAGIHSTSNYVTLEEAYFGSPYAPLNLLLHEGDTEPSRIYSGEGDIILISGIASAEQIWIKSGGNVYFPDLIVRHNQANDVTQVTAGGGIYFSQYYGNGDWSYDVNGIGSKIALFGEGRLEIEAGTDLWIPDNSRGITTDILQTFVSTIGFGSAAFVPLDPDMEAADIAISVGYNETPDYEAFFAAYLDPDFVAEMADYLLVDVDGEELSLYLFDTYYARGNGAVTEVITEDLASGFVNYIRGLQGLDPLADEAAQQAYLETAWAYWVNLPTSVETPYDELVPRYTSAATAAADGAKGEYFLPEERQGLINYIRELQGLDALETAEEQLAYMDEALAYWETLNIVYTTAFYRSVLFLELRTASREANDPDSDRGGSVNRGYDAIATLYPGAEKSADEQLAEGETRWEGDVNIFASPILSNGGGDVSIVAPGGFVRLASASATADQTGQPSDNNPQGDALRAGIVTQGGGAVSVLSYGDVDVNQARVLTSQGGDILMWSSYGNIAAGNGAKTSLAAPYFERSIDELANLTRSPAGLPTGAGIGTLATTEGVPPADVDLVANYGVVDAGDSGIRVSGNFNVFAVEILGTNNIDISGRSTGLPETPAAPPTSLDVDDAGSKSLTAGKALDDAIGQVRRNNAVTSPSLIEVEVVGYGDDDCVAENGTECVSNEPADSGDEEEREDLSWSEDKVEFNVVSEALDDAVRDVGSQAGYNVLYDAGVTASEQSGEVSGRMTLKDALNQLLGDGLEAVLVDEKTIMIRRKSI